MLDTTTIDNRWEATYKIKPPTMKEFLTDTYLGEQVHFLFPIWKDVLIDFWDSNEFRTLIIPTT